MNDSQPGRAPGQPDDLTNYQSGRIFAQIASVLFNGFPLAARLKKSLRVGGGAATLAALDGTDGAIMADGPSAALLTRDRNDATKYASLYRNNTIRLGTEAADLWLINAATGRGLSTSLASYAPTGADLMNATAIVANTWTDLATVTGGFTPANANSAIWVSVRGAGHITAAAGSGVGGRLLLDGATAFQLPSAPGITGPATSYCNVLGGAMVPLGSLSAAAHTLKVQVWCNAAATGYCRVNTQPNIEFLNVDIWEVRS